PHNASCFSCSFYNLDDVEHSTINKYLSSLVGKSLMELESSYCLEIAEDNRTIIPQTLGRIASYYYLKNNTVRMFRDAMKSDCSIPELLDILSNAAEYAELPVRHNEDQINGDLAGQVPLEVNKASLDSAHTKTNLLLQAYLSHLPLPSSDYHTDTKSVLDQALRVLQAMLDVSADQGWLVTSLNVIILLQMLVQGRWWHDCNLLTLPHVQPYHIYCFRNSTNEKKLIDCLPELIDYCDGQKEVLASMLGGEMNKTQVDQLFEVLVRLPLIEVSIEIKGWLEGEQTALSRPVNLSYKDGRRPNSDWLKVHADQEYVLNISLKRINKIKKTDSKAHSLSFPKPKDEGWMLVIGNIESREVIALKRVPWVRGRTSTQMAFYTPERQGRVIYTLYLMSDAYLGLDQQYDICLDIIEPSVETQDNSELQVIADDNKW
ncbi:activating signal cointegrator 1 complex subunit 3-like, partial [Physella acuta]|uniref:activating signal cointegrator 1 complex subunit 3-like n=1 Tax=Physella acuta TaxID=109671 RepID=UPI0027DBD6E1